MTAGCARTPQFLRPCFKWVSSLCTCWRKQSAGEERVPEDLDYSPFGVHGPGKGLRMRYISYYRLVQETCGAVTQSGLQTWGPL